MKAKIKKLLSSIKQFFTLKFGHGEKLELVYPISWEMMSHDDFKSVCTILSQPHGKKESLFLFLCALAHIRPDNPIKYDPKQLGDNLVFIIGDKSYIITPSVIQEACSQLEFIFDTVGLPPCPIGKVDRKLYGISFSESYSRLDTIEMESLGKCCFIRYAVRYSGEIYKITLCTNDLTETEIITENKDIDINKL